MNILEKIVARKLVEVEASKKIKSISDLEKEDVVFTYFCFSF